MITEAQRELLVDKYVLWERASREGNMELRDYNKRAAAALKAALMVCADAGTPSPSVEGELVEALKGRVYVTSGPHLSGYRVQIGFNTGAEAFACHSALSRARGE